MQVVFEPERLPDDLFKACFPQCIASYLQEFADQYSLTQIQVVEMVLCFFLGIQTSSFDSSGIPIPANLAEENRGLFIELNSLLNKHPKMTQVTKDSISSTSIGLNPSKSSDPVY